MVKLVHIDANTFKIAKPGINVDTAADRDLLLSLSAQNAQLIAYGRFMFTNVVFNDFDGLINARLLVTYPDYGSKPFFVVWPIRYTQNYDYTQGTSTVDGPMTTKTEENYTSWDYPLTLTSARTGYTNSSADFDVVGLATRTTIVHSGQTKTQSRTTTWGFTVAAFRRKII